MMRKEDIKNLLLERNQFSEMAKEGLDYDTNFVVDSITLLWILDRLNQEFNIKLGPEQIEWDKFNSINAIYHFLSNQSSINNQH